MAEISIPQNACVVYWLYDDACTSIWQHGYIGVSERWEKQRLKHHQRNDRWPPFKWKILFIGMVDDCYSLEGKLRPDCFIGWNIARGGGGSIGFTGPMSESHREKLRKAALDRWADEEKRKKHREVCKKAFEAIDRSGINNGHFGKILSTESKQNISAARKGKAIGNQNWRKRGPYSEEALRKMSEASRLSWQTGDRKIPRGKDHPMFGRHHSEESKRKNREAQLLHDWSGERNGFYGKKHSDETRKILSMKAKLRNQTKEK